MVRTEDETLTQLIKEQTRLRTMGLPPPRVEGTYQTIAQKMAAAGKTGENGRPTTAPGPRKVDLLPFGGNGAAGNGGGSGAGVQRPPSRGHRLGSGSGVAGNSDGALRPLTALGARQAESMNGVSSYGAARPSSAGATMGGAWAVPVATSSLSEPQVAAGSSTTAPQMTTTTNRPIKLKGPPVKDEKDTFKSKLPIKWAVAGTGPTISAYVDAYGAPGISGGQASALGRHNLTKPVKYKEVTCPIGAVNPHTALAPERAVYPVPQAYVTGPPAFPMGQGSDSMMETLHRATYAPRNEEDVRRSLAAAAEQTALAHAMAQKSTLPLGKNALGLLPSKNWCSDYDSNFVTHKIDVAADYERAQGLKAYLSGPTASAGRLTAKARQPSAPPATQRAAHVGTVGMGVAAAAVPPQPGPGPALRAGHPSPQAPAVRVSS